MEGSACFYGNLPEPAAERAWISDQVCGAELRQGLDARNGSGAHTALGGLGGSVLGEGTRESVKGLPGPGSRLTRPVPCSLQLPFHACRRIRG